MSDKIPDIHNFPAYPNPTTGIITISEELTGSEYYIFATTGVLVKSGKIIGNQINLSDLTNGLYLIKIKKYKLNSWKTAKVIKVN